MAVPAAVGVVAATHGACGDEAGRGEGRWRDALQKRYEKVLRSPEKGGQERHALERKRRRAKLK